MAELKPNVPIGLPRRLVLSNALSAEQQVREMLIEKHKQLKKVQPILDAVAVIDQTVERYIQQAKSHDLPIPDLALMEQEASEAAALEPRQLGMRARMDRPIMVALAQEALARREDGMTLREIMDYLTKNEYPVLSDKILQGSLIAMIKEPSVFASGINKEKKKVYRLVKPDQRFINVAKSYREWRKARTEGSRS